MSVNVNIVINLPLSEINKEKNPIVQTRKRGVKQNEYTYTHHIVVRNSILKKYFIWDRKSNERNPFVNVRTAENFWEEHHVYERYQCCKQVFFPSHIILNPTFKPFQSDHIPDYFGSFWNGQKILDLVREIIKQRSGKKIYFGPKNLF